MHHLVEHCGRIELGREHATRPCELLRQRACRALRLEELAPLERSPGRFADVAGELEIVVQKFALVLEEHDDEAGTIRARGSTRAWR